MMCVNVGVVLMLFLCCVCGQRERVVTERKVDIPPLILQHPPRIVPFVVGESIELKCVASGQPKPEYRWEMDDREFSPSGNDPRVIIQPGVGTLIFVNPILKDEGFFKCFASNRVGTAVTDVIYLRQARLDRFLAQSHPYRHSPHLGEGLKLPCIIPTSYPKAVIFWGIISQTGTYEPVVTTDRITIDPEGNLFFANIIPGDAKGGRQYACIAQNLMMRKTERGAFAFISPQGQTVLNMKPTIVWKPHTNQVAVRGETLSIKCIFSGSPTPRVDWERLEKPMSPRARIDSYGQELIIENVQFEDAGTYQCGGINTETSSAVRSSFNVEVESAPYWLPGKRPESVDAVVGDTAVFYCEAAGRPSVEYQWFLNGVRIERLLRTDRRVQEKNKLTFLNVSKDDAMVIQCGASNKHSHINASAYLSVLTEPPLIQIPPEVGQAADEGQNVNLTCTVFESPKPIVIWHKGHKQLTGGRYKIMDHGDLQIMNVSSADAGTYTCTAQNKVGVTSATGSLVVRQSSMSSELQPKTTLETDGAFVTTTSSESSMSSELQLKTTLETDGAYVTTASSSETTAKSSAVSSVRGGLLQDVLTQLLRLAQLTL